MSKFFLLWLKFDWLTSTTKTEKKTFKPQYFNQMFIINFFHITLISEKKHTHHSWILLGKKRQPKLTLIDYQTYIKNKHHCRYFLWLTIEGKQKQIDLTIDLINKGFPLFNNFLNVWDESNQLSIKYDQWIFEFLFYHSVKLGNETSFQGRNERFLVWMIQPKKKWRNHHLPQCH